MNANAKTPPAATAAADLKEPLPAQLASFVELFVWLLVLRGFFLPLFIIPTGSMAETLAGAYATHTCRNCGFEQQIGFHMPGGPAMVECPNCRWQERTVRPNTQGIVLNEKAGDRIVVHGWPYVFGGELGPRRWEVVVFRNPNDPQQNYIKRLVGLPGETIEIIDGDIWVTPPGASTPELARKTTAAQDALWFTQYDHDYPPRMPSVDNSGVDPAGRRVRPPMWLYFKPRWVALSGGGWSGLETRVLQFGEKDRGFSQVQFTTGPEKTTDPGEITDIYGYNGYYFGRYPQEGREVEGGPLKRNLGSPDSDFQYHAATDVRVSGDVEFADGAGFVELSVSKYNDLFYARLYRDGRVTLEHENRNQPGREPWGEARVSLGGKPIRFGLGHADYQVIVEVDGVAKLTSTASQYPITQQVARDRAKLGLRPVIRIAAQDVRVRLSHVRIDRDGYYASDLQRGHNDPPPQAIDGHPIKLRDDAYLVFGDNSTQSLDARYWQPPPAPGQVVRPNEPVLAFHLQDRYRRGVYTIGTVPADQMIGQAFFVYWPGFMPVAPSNPRIWDVLPDFGRIRWIR